MQFALTHLTTILTVGLPVLFVLFWLLKSVRFVGSTQYVEYERRYIGKNRENGRIVALPGEIGVQAEILLSGWHFLPWPFYAVRAKRDFLVISDDQMGVVTSVDGKPLAQGEMYAVDPTDNAHEYYQDAIAFLQKGGLKGPQLLVIPPGKWAINTYLFNVTPHPVTKVQQGKLGGVIAKYGKKLGDGHIIGRRVEGHNQFTDAQAFVKNGGQPGPQSDTLTPGNYRIHPMFEVVPLDITEIPTGSVGNVEALDGQPLGSKDMVADTLEGVDHQNFQDAEKFLSGGGKKGPQFPVLPPGRYRINTLAFSVDKNEATTIEKGFVGVLINNFGKEPPEPVGGEGTLTHVVPVGYRGIQSAVLAPGQHNINLIAQKVEKVPVAKDMVDWSAAEERSFDPFEVYSGDMMKMRIHLKVLFNIDPEDAPFFVFKIGSVEKLVNNILHPLIEAFVRNQASSSDASDYAKDRQEEQRAIEESVASELRKYRVNVSNVLICHIEMDERLLKTNQDRVIAAEQVLQYQKENEAQQARIALEQTRAQADKQREVIGSQLGISIAENEKQSTIKRAEAEAQQTELVGLAQAKAQEALGAAQGAEYKAKIEALRGEGGEMLRQIKVVEMIAGSNLKLVPDTLIQGGSGEGGNGDVNSSLLTAVLVQAIKPNSGPKDVTTITTADAADVAAPAAPAASPGNGDPIALPKL